MSGAVEPNEAEIEAAEVVHKCPRWGESFTPCCGRNPFELPRTDRMTDVAGLVTCRDWSLS